MACFYLQIEIGMTLLYDSYTQHMNGDPIEIAVGVKHATDYYWVGSAQVSVSAASSVLTSSQVNYDNIII